VRCIRLLLAFVLLISACTGQPPDPTVGGGTATGAGTTSQSAAAEVLAFQATTVGGTAFDGGEYAGKDLMLWFWAPW
jgi:hypothetical protein